MEKKHSKLEEEEDEDVPVEALDQARVKQLIDEAEKKLNPGFWGKMFGSGGMNKYDDAAENYSKVGHLYRLAKNYHEAGLMYEKAASCYLKGGSNFQAAGQYVQASTAYRKSSSGDCIRTLEQASSIFAHDGKFSLAAKNYKTLAEASEKEMDIESAIIHYEKAAEYYDLDNSTVSARGCKIKVAQFAGEKGEYQKAIQLYEQAAKDCMDSRTGPYAAKDHFLRAGLCYLANDDATGLRQALLRWKDISASFERERECKFLESLLESYGNGDSAAFTNVVTEYNNMSPLDAWKLNVLAKIKEVIKADGDAEGKFDPT
eukprot:TRINITY_DN7610_c0_g1_i1.p1 TRINITY_DN7610_c0_g1~~TRINITY_DN7610_c0_g1_i1.p1  ORF type:complete len:317 (+),score=103.08 TRINITY_DN7610_c0_g1_i1:43-993(+)